MFSKFVEIFFNFMNKSILLGVVTSIHKQYCDIEFFQNIQSLSYPAYQILVVDNTNDNGVYADRIKSLLFKSNSEVIHINPENKKTIQIIADCQNILRTKALAQNLSLLIIESDIMPPLNFIGSMVAYNANVLCLPYWYEKGNNKDLLDDPYQKHPLIRRSVKISENQVKPVDLSFVECMFFMDGRLKLIHEAGLGCCLIDNSILDLFEFKAPSSDGVFSDSMFFTDMFNLRVAVYADTSICLVHLQGNWSIINYLNE